jgi:hypothetical protein
MEKKATVQASPSSPMWERLDAFVREQVQPFIHARVEEEVPAWLGRPKSARRVAVDAPGGMRNGHGQPRRFTLPAGTITVCRQRSCQ